jgi:hypothetical protein
MERKKILIYAQGGGLGHLQRSIYLMKTLNLQTEQVILASASNYTQNLADLHKITPLLIPKNFEFDKQAYQNWLIAQINYLNIKEIYVDVFPCGIVGEWNNFLSYANEKLIEKEQIKFHYVARRMKWQKYNHLVINSPFFETSLLLEELEPAHLEFVEKNSQLVVHFFSKNENKTVQKKVQENSQQQLLEGNEIFGEIFWLVIHSEPLEELIILLEYTFEKYRIKKSLAKIIVVTQIDKTIILQEIIEDNNFRVYENLIDNLLIINSLEINSLLEKAEKIISACGFNIMQQTKKFANKHEFIPFERRYDDQFWRAKQRT